jgi:hypothetical protein
VRTQLAKELHLENHLDKLFHYRFEVLNTTLSYVKELWNMTRDYVSSAIQVLVELQNKSTDNSIKSLQIITSIGVIAGVLGYLTKDQLPSLTTSGAVYFGILLVLTLMLNAIVALVHRNQKYRLKFSDIAENI